MERTNPPAFRENLDAYDNAGTPGSHRQLIRRKECIRFLNSQVNPTIEAVEGHMMMMMMMLSRQNIHKTTPLYPTPRNASQYLGRYIARSFFFFLPSSDRDSK